MFCTMSHCKADAYRTKCIRFNECVNTHCVTLLSNCLRPKEFEHGKGGRDAAALNYG